MRHFAYASNMNCTLMSRRCPTALRLGVAHLNGWRLIITSDGYASIVPAPGEIVHGVLWRLMPRDWAILNAYESLESNLYRRQPVSVVAAGQRVRAIAYVARDRTPGRPKPGYLDTVIAAAAEWELPADYIRALGRWSAARSGGMRAPDVGDTR